MYKILAVDDEAPIRRWLEYCIRKYEGFELVGAASNSAEAMELFRKHAPDIVITDIVMPGMNGLELLAGMYAVRPDMYSIILTSHENFAYAREAVKLGTGEYILKTEISDESLRASVEAAAKTLNDLAGTRGEYNHAQLHYLQSLALEKERIAPGREKLQSLGVYLQEENIIAINLRWLEKGGDVSPLIRSAACLQNTFCVPLNYEESLVLSNLRHGEMHALCEACAAFQRENACSIGISNLHNGFEGLSRAMQEARRRSAMYFYHPSERLFWREAIPKNRLDREMDYLVLYGRELTDQNFRSALEVKNRILEAIRQEKPADVDGVKKLCFSLVVSMIHFTEDEIEEMERYLDGVNRRIQGATHEEEMVQVLDEAFQDFERRFLVQANYSPLVQKSIRFIEDHYNEHISITDVASHVALNADYFSRTFCRETGLRFTVYLNNVRMKKAVHLLENTSLKVYEIAEQVGFSSLSYFSTVFRKHFNQNPYDYQMNHRRKRI